MVKAQYFTAVTIAGSDSGLLLHIVLNRTAPPSSTPTMSPR